jgi:hypothetical protein
VIVHLIAAYLSRQCGDSEPRVEELTEVLCAAAADDDFVQHIWTWGSDVEMRIAVFCVGLPVQLALDRFWSAFNCVLNDSSTMREWELMEIHVLPIRKLNLAGIDRKDGYSK